MQRLTCFAAVLCAIFAGEIALAQDAPKEFPSLTAEGNGVRVTSAVQPFTFNELPKKFAEELHYVRPDMLEPGYTPALNTTKGYRYTYIFRNSGKARIQLLFGDRSLLDCPLPAITQSPELTIDPGRFITISYVAFGLPQETEVQLLGAAWDSERDKWIFGGVGIMLISVYLPPFNAPFILPKVTK